MVTIGDGRSDKAPSDLDPGGCCGAVHCIAERQVGLYIENRGSIDDICPAQSEDVAFDRNDLKDVGGGSRSMAEE